MDSFLLVAVIAVIAIVMKIFRGQRFDRDGGDVDFGTGDDCSSSDGGWNFWGSDVDGDCDNSGNDCGGDCGGNSGGDCGSDSGGDGGGGGGGSD
ncbi:hypothetical protein H1S01_06995 [Heliobacterium chlorum]|uniref:Uncharacterized protein n=1 Tax=Heliobacterium chlorum TaxID=2698 RepID=A0ABR7T3L3_HELCL|nr:hypothetical protein [Heliobacterium chlorum]MBC9784256.1 hypothetical protein [Heliobacterium chlorum]